MKAINHAYAKLQGASLAVQAVENEIEQEREGFRIALDLLKAENANLKSLLTRCQSHLNLAELAVNPKSIAGYERDMNNIKIALHELKDAQ